jgi:hypothetical protein
MGLYISVKLSVICKFCLLISYILNLSCQTFGLSFLYVEFSLFSLLSRVHVRCLIYVGRIRNFVHYS